MDVAQSSSPALSNGVEETPMQPHIGGEHDAEIHEPTTDQIVPYRSNAGLDGLDAASEAAARMLFVDDATDLTAKLPTYKLGPSTTVYMMHIPKTSGTALAGQQLVKMGHGFNVDFAYRTPASSGGWAGYKTEYWGRYRYGKWPCLKVAVIRNPFDMLVSYYCHGDQLREDGQYCHSGWAAVNYTHQFKSFEQFIRAYCDPDFQWHQPLFKQFLFSQIFDDEDNCVADLLFKYETLNKALPELRKVGLEMHRESSKNKSKRRQFSSYKEYYTPELRALVEQKCARELRAFGYDFDGGNKQSNFIIPGGLKYDVKGDRLYSVDAVLPEEKTCPNGCGFAVTWHPTHCCHACAANGKHGSRCQMLTVTPNAASVAPGADDMDVDISPQ